MRRISASLAHAQTGRATGHLGLWRVVRANQKVLVAPSAQPGRMPPRTPFAAAEDRAATVPGVPDARFWADSQTDFEKALLAKGSILASARENEPGAGL
jgi:hypothetical protein